MVRGIHPPILSDRGLTNAAKHSRSDRAEVWLTRTCNSARGVVRDEGRGGAESAVNEAGDAGGSGLSGMRRRVAALDGTFTVSSPLGGPTVIEAELPCVW